MRTAYFERFSIDIPEDAIVDCSHSGRCDEDVKHWCKQIVRPPECTVEALVKELNEYGAWDGEELKDDDANWERILWLGAGKLNDEIIESEND